MPHHLSCCRDGQTGLLRKNFPRLRTCSSNYPNRECLWQKLILSLDESFSDWIFISSCNYTLANYKLENEFSGSTFDQCQSINSQYTPAETNALAGMVINQAVTISSATLQRTLAKLSEDPTPMIAELTTWDVLTGNPKKEAVRITKPEVNCVEKL